MQFWGKILELLNAKMETPTLFGWFHLLFFALSIIFGVLLCIIFKNPSEKTARRVVLVITVITVLFEVYKQINYTFSYDGVTITKDFQWYAFPFQFCSMPMYVGLIAGLFKGRIHKAMCAFLATFAMFAGVCVMVYPAQVFITTIGINVQTMICHGSMISVGIFLLGTGYVRSEHKTILRAIPVFASAVLIAMILNEVVYKSGVLNGETFNMFYISPYYESTLPVYSTVHNSLPYPWGVIIYIFGFSLASYVILLISMLVHKIAAPKRTNKA